jgi:hypothetical protein
MKYYHVNQGFTSEEASLGIYCEAPVDAARIYFKMLIFLEGKMETVPPVGNIRITSSCTPYDLDDLYCGGCFVEERQSDSVWHVKGIDGTLVAKKERASKAKARKAVAK